MLCTGVALQIVQPILGKSIIHIVQKKAKELLASDDNNNSINVIVDRYNQSYSNQVANEVNTCCNKNSTDMENDKVQDNLFAIQANNFLSAVLQYSDSKSVYANSCMSSGVNDDSSKFVSIFLKSVIAQCVRTKDNTDLF